eukprot:gb/GFBE01073997.1/.p1 GENE.gb/GFBE01073997.1/~~gb/GFBE01073997.1/.p1  ORF type:complete len:681 (+),score=232.05 gb/GFBE01073997.1/:1-2043(+)
MKFRTLLTFLAIVATVEAVKLRASRDAVSPMAKVVQLIEGLEAKVVAEGEREEETHLKFQSWCKETNATKRREMKTAEARREKFSAIVSKTESQAQVAAEKIAELQAAVAEAQDDLKNASSQREKEAADFESNEQQLMEAHDTASRAISVLKEEAKSKPALLQTLRAPLGRDGGGALLTTLSALADAAVMNTQDSDQLQNLLLMQKESVGAPEADAYTPQHGGIVDLLEDMLDKTKSQLGDLRKGESDARHNFEMLRQSLEDQISVDQKALASQSSAKLDAEQTRSSAEGELQAAVADFEEATRVVQGLTADCEQSAADYDSSVTARAEEIRVLAQAKDILKQSVPRSLVQTGSYSLLQLTKASKRAGPAEAVRRLARRHNSTVLAQLATRMEAVLRLGDRAGEDPFEKVRGLVSQMIARLEEQRAGAMKQEEYCEQQTKKTADKKEELENSAAKVNAKLEKATSLAASLQEEISELRANMATDQQEQKELSEIRQKEHEDYLEAKEELEQGLEGVRKATSVLSDYYQDMGSAPPEISAFLQEAPPMPAAFEKKSEASSGILQILDQAETDMASDLAAEESKESAAAEEYDKSTKEAQINSELQKKDMQHKTQQAAALKKQLSELEGDSSLAGEELSAVKEYEVQLQQQCVIKGESFEERKAKREADIAGLREAIDALSG